MRLKATQLSVLTAITLAGTASSTTLLLQDGFTTTGIDKGGPYTSSLAGTAPTVGSGTWTGNAETGGWGQTGSGFATPSSSNFLAFTPVQGFVYTLTATMDWTSNPGGDRWMMLAFTNFNNHNWDGTGNYLTAAGANSLTEAELVRAGDATQTYTVTLDTTAPGWTNTAGYANVGWIMGNAGAANIGASRISNFSLTAVPEPAAALFGGLGLLTLLRRRRA